ARRADRGGDLAVDRHLRPARRRLGHPAARLRPQPGGAEHESARRPGHGRLRPAEDPGARREPEHPAGQARPAGPRAQLPVRRRRVQRRRPQHHGLRLPAQRPALRLPHHRLRGLHVMKPQQPRAHRRRVRVFALSTLTALICLVTVAACTGDSGNQVSGGNTQSETTYNEFNEAIPYPYVGAAPSDPLERENLAARLKMYNSAGDTNYVYLFAWGSPTPIGYYVIKGK